MYETWIHRRVIRVNNTDTMTTTLVHAPDSKKKFTGKKLAVLGAGKLGGILLRAYLRQGLFAAKNVSATVKHAEKAAALSKELGITATVDNKKAVHGADIVLLGVKPQVVGE